jgi:prealbumin domain-containing protein
VNEIPEKFSRRIRKIVDAVRPRGSRLLRAPRPDAWIIRRPLRTKETTMQKFLSSAVIAMLMIAAGATRASAQNPFIIDGVVPANGSFSGPTQTADPFGNVKELGPLNGNATKVGVIHTAVPPMLAFTNPNGQVDLRNIWTQTTKGADGHIWFYFAWERDANTGSGFIAYEFQQAALSPSCAYTAADIDMIEPQSPGETALISTCNPWQNRQPGDFLILWDQSGSALAITKRVFTLSGGQLVLGPIQPLGSAVAAISPDGFRGEAAIDLTTDVFPPDGSCVNFANIIPGTVTGNSDSADYKDTVLAAFAPISSCGTVTVTKITEPSGLTGTFPYTLRRADGSAIRFDGTVAINQTLTHDGDSTGSPIQNLKAGTNYTLTEAAQTSPWQLVSISCTTDSLPPVDLTSGGTFTVDANTLTACTIKNRRLRGSIRVIKHVVNDNGGTAAASAFTLTLGDTANTTFAGFESPGITFTFDEGYTFNVTEIGLPAGYVQTGAVGDCAGAIVASVTKVCTITNDDVAPRLTVIKHVVNDDGGTATATQWTMNVAATNPSAASFAGTEAPGTTITLNAGSFNVTESGGPAGYVQTGAVGCSGTIAIGESKTCTITNDDQPAHLTVIKHVINDNGGTAIASQWTMNVTATNPSSASFPGAEAPGTTITLSAGAFSVAESTGPAGYVQVSAVGCSGTIAVGESKTCTITNDDTKANPAAATLMSWILHDSATVTGIRPGAANASSATITFRLYGPGDTSCTTPINGTGEVRPLVGGTAATVAGFSITQAQAGQYRWVATYSGDQFNNPYTTACGAETHTITVQ